MQGPRRWYVVVEASRPLGPKVDRRLVERIKGIEGKWRERWERDRLFEADPDPSRPKFFVTFPYPYMNALAHLGGAFTVLRVDITARYKRMRGYNVLFPQGWHATGGPIVSAALRVREGDRAVIEALKLMGISDEDIPKFGDPSHWVRYFTVLWREDFKRYGLSIDWRREFYTTSLNPYYSKFIEWQYTKLRERGFVGKGTHPVVWCPKEGKVVGDHDRPDEYAGIGPEEAVIIKFPGSRGLYYPALTYRPETVYGVTNIWVSPGYKYLVASVNGERWVLNEYMARELAGQGFRVRVEGEVEGASLVGDEALNPVTGEKVPVLPARFVDPGLGTGVVMSVPAHAPYDLVALEDLRRGSPGESGVPGDLIESLKPKPLIRTPGYSRVPAEDVVRKYSVRSQEDVEGLEKATKELYSREFHEGVLLEVTGRWSGMRVREAKDRIASWLAAEGHAIKVYTLPQRVYCRCGERTHVNLVRDQWFLLYSRDEWKRMAHEALEGMAIYPPELKSEFAKTIDWLGDWAFTHKGELGTRLPWDPEWVIESLSDSTIYMAYYTIAKYLQGGGHRIDPEQLKPELFDYVFLGEGRAEEVARSTGISREIIEGMRREFTYWYPVDLRISGKDLVNNHLVFYILHHVAIFPREFWPRGIGVNGWITVMGEKMSKSKGNFITLREALDWWGADATRWAETLAGADPGLDDANFEPQVADRAVEELLSWISFAKSNYGRGRQSYRWVDRWFESVLNSTVKRVTELMDETRYKAALVEAYYELQAKFRWYLRRAGEPNKEVLRKFIEVQTLLIAPFAPHVADEAWESIGKSGYASLHPWPRVEEDKISPEIERAEEIVKGVLEDSREILKLIGRASLLRITVASAWKYRVAEAVKRGLEEGMSLRESLRRAARADVEASQEDRARLIQLIARKPEILDLLVDRKTELEALRDSAEFLSKELGVRVTVEEEEESDSPRAKHSIPGKPALYAVKS